MKNVIDCFDGPEHGFLSNFWPSVISFNGTVFPTVEHAFQAQKSHGIIDHVRIAAIETPGKAKRAGQKLDLRADWDAVRVGIMHEILRVKFAPGSELAARLLATGDRTLIEGNNWNDNFWGVCNGEGKNMLGKLLMQIRAELSQNATTLAEELKAQAYSDRLAGYLSRSETLDDAAKALVAQQRRLEAVRALHTPISSLDALYALEAPYDICSTCCRDSVSISQNCLRTHDHRPGKPICRTIAALEENL